MPDDFDEDFEGEDFAAIARGARKAEEPRPAPREPGRPRKVPISFAPGDDEANDEDPEPLAAAFSLGMRVLARLATVVRQTYPSDRLAPGFVFAEVPGKGFYVSIVRYQPDGKKNVVTTGYGEDPGETVIGVFEQWKSFVGPKVAGASRLTPKQTSGIAPAGSFGRGPDLDPFADETPLVALDDDAFASVARRDAGPAKKNKPSTRGFGRLPDRVPYKSGSLDLQTGDYCDSVGRPVRRLSGREMEEFRERVAERRAKTLREMTEGAPAAPALRREPDLKGDF